MKHDLDSGSTPHEKVELVRRRLAETFPKARVRVFSVESQPVVFRLRWPHRDERVRMAWERVHAYTRPEEILPPEALDALELGESVLVTLDGTQIEARRE